MPRRKGKYKGLNVKVSLLGKVSERVESGGMVWKLGNGENGRLIKKGMRVNR